MRCRLNIEIHEIHKRTKMSQSSSVLAMLAELNWQSLAERHRLARLTMFYKMHYQLVAVDMPLTMKVHFCPTCTKNTTAYNILSSRYMDYHTFSFFPRTVREWNTLPEHIVSLTTIEAFKNAIITA